MRNYTFEEDISNLKKEIKANGWYKKSEARMLYELLFHLTLMTGGLIIFALYQNIAVRILAMVVSTVGATGVTTHTHSSSHHSTFCNRKLNNFLVYFGYPFLFGTSATYWWHKHIAVHHPNPNIVGADDDIDLKPIFAFTRDEIANSSSRFQKTWFNYQWLIFPVALSFNGFNIQLSGWKFLIPRLIHRAQRTLLHELDFLALMLHWTVWLFVPALLFGFPGALLFHCLRITLLGYGMYIAFAPAHFPAEAVVLSHENINADPYLKHLATTVNFKTNRVGRLICLGVDYQIEHHLFPGVTHSHYPALSRKLKEICDRHQYPHRTLGWLESLWKSYLIFYTPKEVYNKIRYDSLERKYSLE